MEFFLVLAFFLGLVVCLFELYVGVSVEVGIKMKGEEFKKDPQNVEDYWQTMVMFFAFAVFNLLAFLGVVYASIWMPWWTKLAIGFLLISTSINMAVKPKVKWWLYSDRVVSVIAYLFLIVVTIVLANGGVVG